MQKIFIVEDDEDIRGLVLYSLEANNYACEGFESGETFFEMLNTVAELPDLILLDIMLPGDDGLEILKKMRSNSKFKSIPIIMLTAKSGEIDKVIALDTGADDYVVKPFGVTELLARIKAVLRRAQGSHAKQYVLAYNDIVLNIERRTVSSCGQNIIMTFREFELLRYLLQNIDIVLSRDKLMDEVWGYDYIGESRTVDMHIKMLRQKLGAPGDCIKTIRNIGYKIGE